MFSETPSCGGIEAKASDWQLAGVLSVDGPFDSGIDECGVGGLKSISNHQTAVSVESGLRAHADLQMTPRAHSEIERTRESITRLIGARFSVVDEIVIAFQRPARS